MTRRPMPRPNSSRPLPRPLTIPTVNTLADVRELIERDAGSRVCTENLNPHILMMQPTQNRA